MRIFLFLVLIFSCELKRTSPRKSCVGNHCGQSVERPFSGSRDAEPVSTIEYNQLDHSQKELVDTHNQYRTNVKVQVLQWSDELESYAQNWAESLSKKGCPLKHRSKPKYGENLFWSRNQSYSPIQVVEAWGSEKSAYNYVNNSCASGKVCGHYTQMVWSTTTHIGCAKARCVSEKEEVWVCNYHPFGNYIGQRPY